MGFRAPLNGQQPTTWAEVVRMVRRLRSDRRCPASAQRVELFRGKR